MQPNLLNITLYAILQLLEIFLFVCAYHCKNSFRIKTTVKLCLRAAGEKQHGHLIKIRKITHMKVVRVVNLLLHLQ